MDNTVHSLTPAQPSFLFPFQRKKSGYEWLKKAHNFLLINFLIKVKVNEITFFCFYNRKFYLFLFPQHYATLMRKRKKTPKE